MRPVRVLFGVLPAPLRTALSEVIHSQADIEVVGVASQPTSLLLAAGRLRADIVVLAMVDSGLPGIASHLLDQYPQIRVVAVAADGRQALVTLMRPQVEHIAVSSPADLVGAIRSLNDRPDE